MGIRWSLKGDGKSLADLTDLLKLFRSDVEHVHYLQLLLPSDRLNFQLSKCLKENAKINSLKGIENISENKCGFQYLKWIMVRLWWAYKL